MGEIMPTNAEEKFVHELADMYDAEHQFLDAMRLMHGVASDQKLKTMLGEHIKQTQEQIQRLAQVFSQIDQEPERQECSGAKGLVEEVSKMMREPRRPSCETLSSSGPQQSSSTMRWSATRT
jgi:ferritin-like metal-binding protein YciE